MTSTAVRNCAIRIETERGSWVWCELGEVTPTAALEILNRELDKHFRDPNRSPGSFRMYVVDNER